MILIAVSHMTCDVDYVYTLLSANILLASDWTAKLGDFGVARIIPSEVTSLMTTTIVGTTIFMAPEYRTGTVTPAADVYALGVVSVGGGGWGVMVVLWWCDGVGGCNGGVMVV